MNEETKDKRVNPEVTEKNDEKLDPVKVAEAKLMEVADSLNQIGQDTLNTQTLSKEDEDDVLGQVNAEQHETFLSTYKIHGVDVDDLCGMKKKDAKEGDSQK